MKSALERLVTILEQWKPPRTAVEVANIIRDAGLLSPEWIVPTGKEPILPQIGERVLVLTRDADNDRIQDFARYSGIRNGAPLFRGNDGDRVRVSAWMYPPVIPNDRTW